MLQRLAARLPQRYPFLLDSAAAGPLSQASVLLAQPTAALWLTPDGRLEARGMQPQGDTFLGALEAWWRAEQQPPDPAAALPFTGGWAVFLGYELAREIEPHLSVPRTPLPWVALALRTPCALVHDLKTSRVFAVAEPAAAALLDVIAADACAAALTGDAPDDLTIGAVTEEAPAAYLERVRRAKEYVRAGDVYQANLSRPWDVAIHVADGSLPAAAAPVRAE